MVKNAINSRQMEMAPSVAKASATTLLINVSLFLMRKDFNYLHNVSVEKW